VFAWKLPHREGFSRLPSCLTRRQSVWNSIRPCAEPMQGQPLLPSIVAPESVDIMSAATTRQCDGSEHSNVVSHVRQEPVGATRVPCVNAGGTRVYSIASRTSNVATVAPPPPHVVKQFEAYPELSTQEQSQKFARQGRVCCCSQQATAAVARGACRWPVRTQEAIEVHTAFAQHGSIH
jgi:hypothetical protein